MARQPLAVALCARPYARAVTSSLTALGVTIDAAERDGRPVEVVVADVSGDPAVGEVLARLAGADVVAMHGGSCADAWTAAAARTTAPVVLLASTDTAVGEDALRLLARALEEDPSAVAAVPFPDAGAYVLVRREALGADDSAADLVERVRREGAPVATVAGAGATRTRRSITAVPQRFPAALLDLAVPDALTTGPVTYAGPGTVFKTYGPLERITLGGFCSIADNVRLVNTGGTVRGADGEELGLLLRGVHRPETATTFPVGVLVPDAPFDEAPDGARGDELVVGDDVWLGYGATVIGGVTIGTGAIVGAGSLVRSDVEPYTVVAGNPAREVRKRFPEEIVERLGRIGWPEWPGGLVQANWWWFTRPVEEFVRHFDPAGAGRD